MNSRNTEYSLRINLLQGQQKHLNGRSNQKKE